MKILQFLPYIILLSSRENKPDREIKIQSYDTIVVSQNISYEIVDSTNRDRSKCYFVIVNKDTSDFRPIFIESIEKGNIRIDFNFSYKKNQTIYKEQIAELDKILQKADLEFNLDSLTTIYVGELIQNGDLAVQISEDFKKKFGNEIKPEKNSPFLSNYDKISKFLLESKLCTDLNMLLKPYSISVEKVFIEKAHFTNKQNLLGHSVVEKDTSQIPDQILDCMIWIKLKKNK